MRHKDKISISLKDGFEPYVCVVTDKDVEASIITLN